MSSIGEAEVRAAVERARTLALRERAEGAGNKHDAGKLPLHLLPTDALEAITEILDFGAKKYAPRNWEKGLDWSRVYRAAIGHLFKWWAGAGLDEETGKSHLCSLSHTSSGASEKTTGHTIRLDCMSKSSTMTIDEIY